jgi:hypothetical protein
MRGRMKAKVLFAFATRLVLVIPIVLHLISVIDFYRLTNGQTVSSYHETLPYLYTQITLAAAIITATIPCLRPFMAATATSFGVVTGSGTGSYGDRMSGLRSKSGRGPRSKSNAPISLSSLKGNREPTSSAERPPRWRPRSEERQGYSTTIIHSDQEREPSIGSDVSHQPIIKRDVQYTVTYGDTGTPIR